MLRILNIALPVLAMAAITQAGLLSRQSPVDCRDDLPANTLANVPDAVTCINQLAARGNEACDVNSLTNTLCDIGGTTLTLLNKALNEGGGNQGSGAVTCQIVAQSAGRILDICSRGDGTVRGATDALSNSNVLVDIRRT